MTEMWQPHILIASRGSLSWHAEMNLLRHMTNKMVDVQAPFISFTNTLQQAMYYILDHRTLDLVWLTNWQERTHYEMCETALALGGQMHLNKAEPWVVLSRKHEHLRSVFRGTGVRVMLGLHHGLHARNLKRRATLSV